MSKYLALEWDEHEVRLAIAHERGSAAVLERAFAVPLPLTAEGQSQDAASVAAAIREALAGESLRKIETLAVVGRPSIELKELSLPPAPDDELPDLVRFQALRDFTHINEDTPLDYLPLPVEGDEHRTVLAAAISDELLSGIRATCSQAGLELHHLVLRPCAAASLLCRHRPAPGQIRMFVDLLGDEVDLTVLDRDSPILMRTTRLPGDASQPEYCRPVFLEIRRTIASVQNKLHGRRVEAIALCGDGSSQQLLADLIRTELELPTELFDPFTDYDLAGGLKKRLPERHSRFAPLLGMLADAAAGQRHGIDFLDPHRRPQPKTRRREAAIAIAALAVVIVAVSLWTWLQLRSLDSEIAQLNDKNNSLKKQLDTFKNVSKEAAELKKWTDGDIPWLDVLYRVATQAPKSEDAMLTALTASVDPSAPGGNLHLEGLVGDYSDLSALENQLRGSLKSKVSVGSVNRDDKIKRYTLKFKSDVKITPEAVEAAKAAAKTAAAKTAAKKQSEVKTAAVTTKEKTAETAAAKTDAVKTSSSSETKPAGSTTVETKSVLPADAEKKETPSAANNKIVSAELETKGTTPTTKANAASAAPTSTPASPAGDAAPAPSPSPATTSENKSEKRDG